MTDENETEERSEKIELDDMIVSNNNDDYKVMEDETDAWWYMYFISKLFSKSFCLGVILVVLVSSDFTEKISDIFTGNSSSIKLGWQIVDNIFVDLSIFDENIVSLDVLLFHF